MPDRPLHMLVRHIRRMAADALDGEESDRVLLAKFIAERDEAAFTLLVQRHGPMVRGVCQRLLVRSPDVDDAFQATFLMLVRKASSVCLRSMASAMASAIRASPSSVAVVMGWRAKSAITPTTFASTSSG